MNNWPTKAADLQVAEQIIKKHIDFNDGEPLGVFEFITSKSEALNIEVSDWIIELYELFSQKYGHDDGVEITKNIISQCIIANATVH